MVIKPEKIVQPSTAIAILLLTMAIALVVGVFGATLGSEYESSCSAKGGEKPVCTTRYVYKGIGDLDIPQINLQILIVGLSSGFGIYAGLRNGKIPLSLKEMLDNDSAENNNLPGAG